jgi:hypothetical protein
MLEDWVDKTGKGQWEWDKNVKSEAAAKEKYGDKAKYAAPGETYYAKDGRQVVLQDQGNWSYTSQTRGDPNCPSCGLNNGNTGWLEQFQSGVRSYQPLLKAAEISLTVSAVLLSGEIGAGASLVSKGTQVTKTVEQSLVQANRAAGNAFRDEIAAGLAAEGRQVTTEVYKRTPFGARYIDIEVSMSGKVLGGIETKVGSSRYLPLQRMKDIWLDFNTTGGYPVQLVRKQ